MSESRATVLLPCPDEPILRQFLDDSGSRDADSPVARHLNSCPVCQVLLDILAQEELPPVLGPLTTTRSRSDDEPPHLPGHESVGRIGEGGMGVVWRVRDVKFQRHLAVKVMRWAGCDQPRLVRRFFAEAQITGQLTHPSIVPIHALGRLSDGRLYYSMKLVEGQTLAALLAARQTLSERLMEFVQIFGQVCQALAFAHSRGVIHRDLKPGNVMVGEHGEVQVMDWGLAKALGDRDPPPAAEPGTADATAAAERTAEEDATAEGSKLGSPPYMPPEQARGQIAEVDRRSDVFGLGAILCEILTGQPPYTGSDRAAVLRKATEADQAEARERLRGCGADPELIRLAKCCLAPGKSDRPADAGELANQLTAYVASVQERLRQAELLRDKAEVQAAEQRKRRRVLTIAGGVLVAVLAAGIVGTTIGLLQARHARQIAEEAKRKAEKAEDDTLAEFRAGTNDAIEQLIGSKPTLGPQERAYLERTLQRWQAFADRQGTDERSRAIRAEGTFRVARLWRNLWKWDEAIKEYKKARDLYRQLVADFPTSPNHKQRLAWTHNNLAGLLADSGKGDEAIQEYRLARDLHRQLVDQVPDEPRYQRDLANTHSNLALLLTRFGHPDEAVQEFEQAFVRFRKLHHDNPAERDYRHQLADTHNKRGELFSVHLGRMEEALEEHEQALKLAKDLVKEKDDERAYKLELADAHAYRGMVLAGLGRKQEAIRAYGESRKWGRPLVEAYPGIAEYKQNLARTCSSLGESLADLGMLDKALPEYEEAQQHQLTLVGDYDHVPRYKEDLANTHNGLGKALSGLKRWKEARKNYEKALELSLKLVAVAPSVSSYQVTLGQSYGNVGAFFLEEGKPADSLEWLDKAIQTLTPVSQKEPRYTAARLSLRDSHGARAGAYEQLKKPVEAEKDWVEALRLTSPEEHPAVRVARARSRLQAGMIAEAVAEITELTAPGTDTPWTADQWYNLARVYAVASTKIAAKKQNYEDRAMELLRQTVKAGWKDGAHMAKDPDLAPRASARTSNNS